MIFFALTEQSRKKFLKLLTEDQNRISNKLKTLKNHPEIFRIIIRLSGFETPTYRLRIGSHRLIMRILSSEKNNTTFVILNLGHRREIYN